MVTGPNFGPNAIASEIKRGGGGGGGGGGEGGGGEPMEKSYGNANSVFREEKPIIDPIQVNS